MDAQEPDFRIFMALRRAVRYASKLVVNTDKTYCIWAIGKDRGYLVAVEGFNLQKIPPRIPPFDILTLNKIDTITPHGATQ